MALDPDAIKTRGTPEWWLFRLSEALSNSKRQERLKLLRNYAEGRPRLPVGAKNCADEFEEFQRKSLLNVASLISKTLARRIKPYGIRTSADSDETGDAEAWKIFKKSRVGIALNEAINDMLNLSEGYVSIGDRNPLTGVPLVRSEDPRECITIEDPATGDTVAGLKVFHNDLDERDYAYLHLPGKLYVAYRDNKQLGSSPAPVHINAQGWTWDETKSRDLRGIIGDRVSIVRLENTGGIGEFEPHLETIDRINHTILQRLVIATHQAFRTFAAIGLPDVYPPGHERAGEEIDYSDVFTSGPGQIWQLPENSSMWQSGQADLTPILSAVKDDIQGLSAASCTPLHVFDPTSSNQSAEGASLSKEGQVANAEDKIELITPQAHLIMQLCFLWARDKERADIDEIEVLWRDPNMPSMAERYDALSKATDVPWRTRMTKILGFSPSEVDRMESERAADQMLEAAFARPTVSIQSPEGQQAQQDQNGGQAVNNSDQTGRKPA